MFEKTLYAGWGDMDFNSHMRNTAYLDKSADVRMMFFSEAGFTMGEFVKRGIGPVIFRDEIQYFKEVRLLQSLRVTLAIAGLADDGGRWFMRNEFHRDGTLVARVTSEGGWLDLGARRLMAPPPELLAALRSLPRTDDFQTLPPPMR